MESSTPAPRELRSPTQRGKFQRVTLEAETSTPRARTMTATFLREATPADESRSSRRQRMKNIGKARARAIIRLDPVKHEAYREAEAARKQWSLWLTGPVSLPEYGEKNREAASRGDWTAAQQRADFKRLKAAGNAMTRRGHEWGDIFRWEAVEDYERWSKPGIATEAQGYQLELSYCRESVSGYTRVSYDGRYDKYWASCIVNGRKRMLGGYQTAVDAAVAVAKFKLGELKLPGEYSSDSECERE